MKRKQKGKDTKNSRREGQKLKYEE